MKLALGKRIPVAPTVMGGGDPSQTSAPAMEPASNHQAERRVESEDESESHASDLTGLGGSSAASPELRGVAAQSSSGTPVARLSGTAPPAKAAATTQGGKKKNRAARRAARAAWEAEDSSPTAGGSQALPVMVYPREGSSVQCLDARGSTPRMTAQPFWT